MRERWGVEARTQLPPRYQGGVHTPDSLGPRPPDEEQFIDEAEEWYGKYREWTSDLAALCEAVVPQEARSSKYFIGSGWDVFLSLCVLFDPPDTQLEEFDNSFDWRHSNVHPRSGVVMYSPPIVWQRDADQAEETMMEFYEGLLDALLEEYVHPQGVTTEEAMERIREERPEVFERMRKRLRDNESRPYINVQPHHKWDDIENAYVVLKAGHDTFPRRGRGQRDKLTAVQCAVLHDRHGWKYEKIAEKYGWKPGSNVVSKYIADGRRILEECPPA
jgi:hypothetical protein